MEIGCRQLFFEVIGMAGRADFQGGITELLQNLLGMAASVAAIGVNRHGRKKMKVKKRRRPSGWMAVATSGELYSSCLFVGQRKPG